MKKQIITAIVSILMCACTKSDSGDHPQPGNNGLPTSAETLPQYNNSSFGVYKGVVLGSSGTIFFRIHNGDNIARGFLNIDNKWDTLTTTSTIVAGQPLINVGFIGRFSAMVLNANADGSHANLSNIMITGHVNPTIFIIHENSTKQIYCYEGTFSGSSAGVFNCARAGLNNGDTAYVLARVTNDTILSNGFGQVNNGTLATNLYRNLVVSFVVQGNFSGNNFNGTWTWSSIGSGSFTCTRTY